MRVLRQFVLITGDGYALLGGPALVSLPASLRSLRSGIEVLHVAYDNDGRPAAIADTAEAAQAAAEAAA